MTHPATSHTRGLCPRVPPGRVRPRVPPGRVRPRVPPGRVRHLRMAGMTVLEIMIVLAIIGGLFFVVRSGFRLVTKADLVEGSTELTAGLRRASELAVEHGELHRVVLDLEPQAYLVEVCQGQVAIARNELLKADDEDTKRALERARP